MCGHRMFFENRESELLFLMRDHQRQHAVSNQQKPTAMACSGYTGGYQHTRSNMVNNHSYWCIISGDLVDYDWDTNSSPVDVPVISNTA